MRCKLLTLLTLLTVLLLLSHCSDEKVCNRNQTQVCVCSGAVPSAQQCSEDGLGWEPCSCPGDSSDTWSGPRFTPDTYAPAWDVYSPDVSYRDSITLPPFDTGPVADTGPPPDGSALYATYCAACHGSDGSGTTIAPDIRRDAIKEREDELLEVILEGKDAMPPINVTEPEALAIISWMKASFKAPPEDE